LARSRERRDAGTVGAGRSSVPGDLPGIRIPISLRGACGERKDGEQTEHGEYETLDLEHVTPFKRSELASSERA
jgi:hypothetical protein